MSLLWKLQARYSWLLRIKSINHLGSIIVPKQKFLVISNCSNYWLRRMHCETDGFLEDAVCFTTVWFYHFLPFVLIVSLLSSIHILLTRHKHWLTLIILNRLFLLLTDWGIILHHSILTLVLPINECKSPYIDLTGCQVNQYFPFSRVNTSNIQTLIILMNA